MRSARKLAVTKRLLLSLFAASLVIAVPSVVALLPAGSALAASPMEAFDASGTVSGIDEGDVVPAGRSGRFVVRERTVAGTLTGDVNGEFTFVYHTNVPILTQSGSLQGILTVEGYTANVVGKSRLGLTPVPCPVPDGVSCIPTPYGNFYPGLLIDGNLTFTNGAQGHGELHAWILPLLDDDGHIMVIIASGFSISGTWKQ